MSQKNVATYDVIVIGAGASGLMAAGRSGSLGAKTLLLEKMHMPGLKLGITGKGRCNLTNASLMESFRQRFKSGSRFLQPVFNRFSQEDLLTFLHSLGIETETQRGSRVFPRNDPAPEVAKKIRQWVLQQGVILKTNTPVVSISSNNQMVSGLEAKSAANSAIYYAARSIILATGGASYPATGSSGDGYRLASKLGHDITQIHPALVPLETAEKPAEDLQGLKLRNVQASVWTRGKKQEQAFGELEFTSFGLSGPVILSLSNIVASSLLKQEKVSIHIDLKPALSREKLENRLLRDLHNRGKETLPHLLRGVLPGRLISLCLQHNQLAADKTGNQVTTRERKKLLNWLKDLTFAITACRPLNEAIVTAGGIDLRQTDPRSMQSRLIQGLFFAGEILDIHADTGGYNLQAAFSTGWLAGTSAAAYSQGLKEQSLS